MHSVIECMSFISLAAKSIESQVWEIEKIIEEPGMVKLFPKTMFNCYLIEIMVIPYLYDHFHKACHPLNILTRILEISASLLARKLTYNRIILSHEYQINFSSTFNCSEWTWSWYYSVWGYLGVHLCNQIRIKWCYNY